MTPATGNPTTVTPLRRFEGKKALVTGAGRGIGKGCALELGLEGAELIINDRPDSPDLAATIAEFQELGIKAAGIEANVFEYEGCETLVEQTLAALGHIDILVSNPAWGIRRDYLDYRQGDFEKIVSATLTSGFHMSRLVATSMVERDKRGKILFISSVQGELPIARCVAYGTAKAGVNHMAKTLAVELSPQQINVNVIEPGWIDTPGEHETFDDAVIEEEGVKLPWGRLGLPRDIGRAAAFLCSDDADYITGTILPVDGLYRYKAWRADVQKTTKEPPA